MIRINLLPFREQRKKEQTIRQIAIFFLSFISALAILFYINSALNNKIDDLISDVENIKIKIASYNKKIKEIERIKKDLKTLEQKTQLIKNLEAYRKEPVRLLDAMTELIIAKRMWFTNFESQKQTVKIKGTALDNQTVADFMIRLESSPLFSRVNLKTSKQQKAKQNINLKTFEIVCVKKSVKKDSKDKAKK